MFILYFSIIIFYIILSKVFKKEKYYNKTPFKNIWTSKNKMLMLSIVEFICGYNNIILIPMYETLLGIYKYKDILPWHGCFEFIVNDKDFNYLINNFVNNKYKFTYTKNEIRVFQKNKNWPYVSITKYNFNPKHYMFQEKDLYPTYEYKFNNIKLNMPNNTENILNNLYNNWETECTSSEYNYKECLIYYKTFTIKWEELIQTNFSTENTWVINLNRHKNRWNITKNRLETLGIIPKRWKATDKNSIEIGNLYKKLKGLKIGMNLGTLACYLSHKKLWEHLYKIEVPYSIIFEDDIIFDKSITLMDINKIFKDSIGFNIIFLGYTCPNRPIFSNKYVTEGGGTCLHAYIISRKGIKNLLSLKHDFTNPIDKITKYFAEDNLCYISKHDTKGKNFGYGIIQQDMNIESDLRLRFNIFGNILSL